MSLVFVPSGLLVVAALVCATVWWRRRNHGELLWLAASLCLAAMSMLPSSVLGAWDVAGWASLWALGAVVAAAQALAQRFGRQVQWLGCVAGAALVLAGLLGSAALPGVSGGELRALGLTVVLGHGLPGAWRAPIRHRGDTALLGVWLLGLLGVLAQPWVGRWGLAYVPGWGVGVLELLIGAGLLTATMLACVWADTRHRSGGADRRSASDTGLADRHAFEAACGLRPFERQIRVLALCDVEHLPVQRGPRAQVQRRFAQILRANVREGDHVAHLGEEAFALALRQIDMANAQALVQRIALQVQEQLWEGAEAGAPEPVSASFGLAMVREADTLAIAMHRADVLLYQAKEGGTGQVGVDEVATEAA